MEGFGRYAESVRRRSGRASPLGHAQRADRVPARRVPRRRDSSGAAEFRARPRAPSSTCSAPTPRRRPRRRARPRKRVGIAHNMLEFAPDRAGRTRPPPCRDGDRLYNTALLEAIATGDSTGPFRAGPVRARIPDLPAANDFVGVNYYSRVHIRFRGRPGAIGSSPIATRTGGASRTPAGRSIPTGSTRPAAGGAGGQTRPRDRERHRDGRRPAPLRLPARARARPRAPPRQGHSIRATSTGRCSTTSSGSRASVRASVSSRSTTPLSPGDAGRPPTCSPRWAGGSRGRERPANLSPLLERDELRDSRFAAPAPESARSPSRPRPAHARRRRTSPECRRRRSGASRRGSG